MAALITSIVIWMCCGLAVLPARADPYPAQLMGAWGGRAEFAGDDRVVIARRACASFYKNAQAVQGDVLVFRENKKFSYGGYADYEDTNISVKQIGPNRWAIVDRHFHDGEGGGRPGNRRKQYEATLVSENTLVTREGKTISRFDRCVQQANAEKKSPEAVQVASATEEFDAGALAEKIHKECGERWGAPGAVASCLLENDKRYGEELAQIYKLAVTQAGQNSPLLRDAQRAWLQYQQTNCRFHQQRFAREGAGVSRALEAKCLLLTTLQRLRELRDLTKQ